ncbi:MAG: DNA-binding protein [Candidatus Xenobiia bacterium LiM19]
MRTDEESLSDIMRRQIPVGAQATFTLDNGREISGQVIEIGTNHVSLKADGNVSTLFIKMVGAWIVKGSAQQDDNTAVQQVATGDDSLEAKSSSVSDNEEIPESEINFEINRIEAFFEEALKNAELKLIPPDFSFPEDEIYGKNRKEGQKLWNSINNRYTNAAKLKELDVKFGKVQLILYDLKSLNSLFPESEKIMSHLAYISTCAGKQNDALKIYQALTRQSQYPDHRLNAAFMALHLKQYEVACHCLEEFFKGNSITDNRNTWSVLLQVTMNYNGLKTLKNIIEFRLNCCSEEELQNIFESLTYVLVTSGVVQAAKTMLSRRIRGESPSLIIKESLSYIDTIKPEFYKITSHEVKPIVVCEKPVYVKRASFPQGHLYKYFTDKGYGFISGIDNSKLFFHKSSIIDDELIEKIRDGNFQRIPVIYESARGPRGLIALGISFYRTDDELYDLSIKTADDGEYNKAIAQMKRLLSINPDYRDGKDLIEKWREYERITGIPKGRNPYAQAKRAQLVEKNLELAEGFFKAAIKDGDSLESAVKDLASLYSQQGRHKESVDTLLKNRTKVKDSQSIDNMLIVFYQNTEQYEEAIVLLNKKLSQTSNPDKKIQYIIQIASVYLKRQDFKKAEHSYQEVMKLQPDNPAVQRSIALCRYKQGFFDEAVKKLNEIVHNHSDAKAVELLEAIKKERETGQVSQIQDIIIDTSLSHLASQISSLTQFFLERCDYQGVHAESVKKGIFKNIDIKNLENLASSLGTSRPRERAGYYLSAAKIHSLLNEDYDSSQFYTYLCRSFASRADAIVNEGKPIDSARELYSEALSSYDKVQRTKRDEQDAVNALVRYLYSTLGAAEIPIRPGVPSIDECIEYVLNNHPDREELFNAIAYVTSHSRYAANRIFNRLFEKLSYKAMTIEYLKNRTGQLPDPAVSLKQFVEQWNLLHRQNHGNWRSLSQECEFLKNMEFTTASTGNGIECVKRLSQKLYLKLDQERAGELLRIFEVILDLCRQTSFEEKERLCIFTDKRCRELLQEIELCPTRFSVDQLNGVVQKLVEKLKGYLEDLYLNTVPRLSLRLPIETCTPDDSNQIELQIVVANQAGCSPAEALELMVHCEDDLFSVSNPDELRINSSLRGGEQEIIRLIISLGLEALTSQTFSLPVSARYKTRFEEIMATDLATFSIRLYPPEEFEEIDNPYAVFAEGGPVFDEAMFYGREETIRNASRAIIESRNHGKCFVIFGQKRAGKSSILYHLMRRLESCPEILVIDLGSIGSILDRTSNVPMIYKIFWRILSELREKIDHTQINLKIDFPNDRDFFSHPDPLVHFNEILKRFKKAVASDGAWKKNRMVLLIDEFSYIYGEIVAGYIPETIMKNWKALLQENLFSAVLVGQDVMPRFKQKYPNEFGATQDERVSYLKRDDAIKLIDEPIRIGGGKGESRYRERAIDRIVDLTAGSPFYIQIICNRLVEYMNCKRAKYVTEADVEQVKRDLIRGVNALDEDKFDNLINSGDTSNDAIEDSDVRKVLKAIAMHCSTGPCNRINISCETKQPVDFILDDLVKRDVIEREREHYFSIKVGLFREWLILH